MALTHFYNSLPLSNMPITSSLRDFVLVLSPASNIILLDNHVSRSFLKCHLIDNLLKTSSRKVCMASSYFIFLTASVTLWSVGLLMYMLSSSLWYILHGNKILSLIESLSPRKGTAVTQQLHFEDVKGYLVLNFQNRELVLKQQVGFGARNSFCVQSLRNAKGLLINTFAI